MIPEDNFVQGAEIVLTCALSGGSTNPGNVTWLKDNQPVDQLNLQSVIIVSVCYNVCVHCSAIVDCMYQLDHPP